MSNLFGSNISIETFLAEYWQQKPLLIRNTFPDLTNPLSPEELAGLACEQGSNARLILEKKAQQNWCVEYGPFDENRFSTLPESGWSLLVSDVERVIPAARKIQQEFRFIPDWRLDDVMFSYAPAGGSVGPHVDAYDVFLLQTLGQRRWLIAEHYEPDFIENSDLKVLQSFEAEQEWILEPGDMLYLPPDIAHHGIAIDACMTCSIGFRAPSDQDMANTFLEALLDTKTEHRYSDNQTSQQTHPGEITRQSIDQIRSLLNSAMQFDDETVSRWFGQYISSIKSQLDLHGEPQSPHQHTPDSLNSLDGNTLVSHNSLCRFFYIRGETDQATLFVDGTNFNISLKFAENICSEPITSLCNLTQTCLLQSDKECLLQLFNRQLLEIES